MKVSGGNSITKKKYSEWNNDGSGILKYHLNQVVAYSRVIPKYESVSIVL